MSTQGLPTLYAPIALPGAGKSTFVNRWIADGVLSPEAVVSPDALRRVICEDQTDQSQNAAVFRVAHTLAEARLRAGRNVYFDATNLNPKSRRALIRLAERARADLVWVKLPTTIIEALNRNAARTENRCPDPVMEHFVRQFARVEWDRLPGEVFDA